MPLRPIDTLKRDADQAQRLVQHVGQQKTLALLQRAQADLNRRLSQAEGLGGAGKDSFTAAHLRATLAQVRAITTKLGLGMQDLTVDQGKAAAALAANRAVHYLSASEKHFKGSTERLNLDTARLVDRAVAGTQSSVLSRLLHGPDQKKSQGILQRYGHETVAHFEDILQARLVARTPWNDVRAQLVEKSPFLQGAPASWAERIVRTECLIGSTPVSGAVVLAAHRRAYEGPVVEVVTEGGRHFTTTPNHPMLTGRAWLAAGDLKPGDYLVCDARQQAPGPAGDEHIKAGPATVGQVFDALAAVGVGKRRRTAQPDFHGDGADGYVDVLCPARPLVVGSFAPIYQPLAERVFFPSDLARTGFCLACRRLLSLQRSHCLCERPDRNLLRAQMLKNGGRAAPQVGADLVGAFARQVASDDIIRHSHLSRVAESFSSHSSLECERVLGTVALDRVVRIEVRSFSGHVFNLTTAHGYFCIAGAYTGNTAYQDGRASNQAIVDADSQLGDMCKIISSIFDSRTGSDSVATHGQIRRPSESFQSWFGSYMHPPDRPNDRSVVVPHRISWPIPAELKPKDGGAVAARWAMEGRKGGPPGRPLMSTIPLDLFGKQAPPPVQPEAQAPPQTPFKAPPGLGPQNARPTILEAPGREYEPVPSKAPPFILHSHKLNLLAKKIAAASGSNPGGVYEDKEGTQRYVKFSKSPEQAYGEHLANQLYRDLGLGGVNSQTFEHEGKVAYASEILKGTQTLGSALTKTKAGQYTVKSRLLARQALNGFAADVLMANWDAAGLNLDNMLVSTDGSAGLVRIDNGAAFLTRAQGALKNPAQLNNPTEWDSFFTSTNPAYKKLADIAGVKGPEDFAASIKSSVAKIVKLSKQPGGWAKYVTERTQGMAPAQQQQIVDMLDARTAFLEQKAKTLVPAAAVAKSVTAKPGLTVAASGQPVSLAELATTKEQYSAAARKAGAFLQTQPGVNDLSHYTGSGYTDVNDHLLGRSGPIGQLTQEAIERRIARIQETLLAAKQAGHALVGSVHRGIAVSPEELASILSGATADFPNFTSTSVQEGISWGFTSPRGHKTERVMFRIRQRSAIPVNEVSRNKGEGESVLPHGFKFRFIKAAPETRDVYGTQVKFTRIDLEEL